MITTTHIENQIGRESWVGFTVASWLNKTERLPSHAGNESTRCSSGVHGVHIRVVLTLGMFEGEEKEQSYNFKDKFKLVLVSKVKYHTHVIQFYH